MSCGEHTWYTHSGSEPAGPQERMSLVGQGKPCERSRPMEGTPCCFTPQTPTAARPRKGAPSYGRVPSHPGAFPWGPITTAHGVPVSSWGASPLSSLPARPGDRPPDPPRPAMAPSRYRPGCQHITRATQGPSHSPVFCLSTGRHCRGPGWPAGAYWGCQPLGPL